MIPDIEVLRTLAIAVKNGPDKTFHLPRGPLADYVEAVSPDVILQVLDELVALRAETTRLRNAAILSAAVLEAALNENAPDAACPDNERYLFELGFERGYMAASRVVFAALTPHSDRSEP